MYWHFVIIANILLSCLLLVICAPPPPPPSTVKNTGNTRDFMFYLNTLIMLRSLKK